jgi:hypothetical protein
LIEPVAAILEHEPEKCVAVFRKDHAQLETWSAMAIRLDPIALQGVRIEQELT